MHHKRSLTISIVFLLIILIAILMIGPKQLEKPASFIIDSSGDEEVKENIFTHKCHCIDKIDKELRWYKYISNSEKEAKDICHTTICQDMFGYRYVASEAKVLKIENS